MQKEILKLNMINIRTQVQNDMIDIKTEIKEDIRAEIDDF